MKRWRENCNVRPRLGQMVAEVLSCLFPLSLCSRVQPKANTWATGAASLVGRSIPQSWAHQSYFWPAATQKRSAALTALTAGWGQAERNLRYIRYIRWEMTEVRDGRAETMTDRSCESASLLLRAEDLLSRAQHLSFRDKVISTPQPEGHT